MGCTLSSDKRRLPAEIRKLQKQHFLSKQNSLKKQDQQVLYILCTIYGGSNQAQESTLDKKSWTFSQSVGRPPKNRIFITQEVWSISL